MKQEEVDKNKDGNPDEASKDSDESKETKAAEDVKEGEVVE